MFIKLNSILSHATGCLSSSMVYKKKSNCLAEKSKVDFLNVIFFSYISFYFYYKHLMYRLYKNIFKIIIFLKHKNLFGLNLLLTHSINLISKTYVNNKYFFKSFKLRFLNIDNVNFSFMFNNFFLQKSVKKQKKIKAIQNVQFKINFLNLKHLNYKNYKKNWLKKKKRFALFNKKLLKINYWKNQNPYRKVYKRIKKTMWLLPRIALKFSYKFRSKKKNFFSKKFNNFYMHQSIVKWILLKKKKNFYSFRQNFFFKKSQHSFLKTIFFLKWNPLKKKKMFGAWLRKFRFNPYSSRFYKNRYKLRSPTATIGNIKPIYYSKNKDFLYPFFSKMLFLRNNNYDQMYLRQQLLFSQMAHEKFAKQFKLTYMRYPALSTNKRLKKILTSDWYAYTLKKKINWKFMQKKKKKIWYKKQKFLINSRRAQARARINLFNYNSFLVKKTFFCVKKSKSVKNTFLYTAWFIRNQYFSHLRKIGQIKKNVQFFLKNSNRAFEAYVKSYNFFWLSKLIKKQNKLKAFKFKFLWKNKIKIVRNFHDNFLGNKYSIRSFNAYKTVKHPIVHCSFSNKSYFWKIFTKKNQVEHNHRVFSRKPVFTKQLHFKYKKSRYKNKNLMYFYSYYYVLKLQPYCSLKAYASKLRKIFNFSYKYFSLYLQKAFVNYNAQFYLKLLGYAELKKKKKKKIRSYFIKKLLLYFTQFYILNPISTTSFAFIKLNFSNIYKNSIIQLLCSFFFSNWQYNFHFHFWATFWNCAHQQRLKQAFKIGLLAHYKQSKYFFIKRMHLHFYKKQNKLYFANSIYFL